MAAFSDQVLAFVQFLNSIAWSNMSVFILLIVGVYFSIRLNFFQLRNLPLLFKNIFGGKKSESGISVFSSFCTCMATRIGIGNIAGVAIAIYRGGPGVLFWMWVMCIFNAATSFIESSAGQLYKRKIDGEYRGSPSIIARFALKLPRYSIFLAIILGMTTAFFLPAAEMFSATDAVYNASGVPRWITGLIIVTIFVVVVIGGIKRIGSFSTVFASAKVLLFMISALVIIAINITKIPYVFDLVFTNAFGLESAIWGSLGFAICNGFRRTQFATSSGMGESMTSSAAAEADHPCTRGFADAAGVFICIFGVCTCSGILILSTDTFVLSNGYVAAGAADIANLEPGVSNVQAAFGTVLGVDFANWFVVVLIFIICMGSSVAYFYEAETSFLSLFQGPNKVKTRKKISVILVVVMAAMLFIYGNVKGELAWEIADFSLGVCTFVNIAVLLPVSSKIVVCYKDYISQYKKHKKPFFVLSGKNWVGVDRNIWDKSREASNFKS